MPTNLTADALLYLWTTPGTADLGYVTPEEFGHRIGATRDLPENIRRILVGQSSADRIQALIIRKHRLAVDQAQTIARTLGWVLRGEESPANFRSLLTKKIEAAPDVVDDIVQILTAEFITPNYFQIAQVYERKHKGEATGRRQQATERPESTAAPRVVDLRNGAIPSRLPPAPAPPPPARPAPTPVPPRPPAEPLSPRPPGTPLESLGSPALPTPPPPTPFVRPPGGGAHGPLPPAPPGSRT